MLEHSLRKLRLMIRAVGHAAWERPQRATQRRAACKATPQLAGRPAAVATVSIETAASIHIRPPACIRSKFLSLIES